MCNQLIAQPSAARLATCLNVSCNTYTCACLAALHMSLRPLPQKNSTLLCTRWVLAAVSLMSSLTCSSRHTPCTALRGAERSPTTDLGRWVVEVVLAAADGAITQSNYPDHSARMLLMSCSQWPLAVVVWPAGACSLSTHHTNPLTPAVSCTAVGDVPHPEPQPSHPRPALVPAGFRGGHHQGFGRHLRA